MGRCPKSLLPQQANYPVCLGKDKPGKCQIEHESKYYRGNKMLLGEKE
ncbi:unnamed protein product [marine sediment metagenome]|uniref:Uncharacterized protein n=1 Tax=marine sediment metagenome TaxID=412755 RepID=X1RKP1_9ZZZZ